MGNGRIADRFVTRMYFLDNGAQLPELARHFMARCPDLVAKLDAYERQVITEAAMKAGAATTVTTPSASATEEP
jgi:hypothetical protein